MIPIMRTVYRSCIFCIRVKDKVNTFEVHAEVTGLERHEIKQMYTDMVFEKLETLVM